MYLPLLITKYTVNCAGLHSPMASFTNSVFTLLGCLPHLSSQFINHIFSYATQLLAFLLNFAVQLPGSLSLFLALISCPGFSWDIVTVLQQQAQIPPFVIIRLLHNIAKYFTDQSEIY